MKKITLIVLMCFASLVGYSQLTENFDGTTALPDPTTGIWTLNSGNWLVRDNMQNGVPNWEYGPAVYGSNSGTGTAFIQRELLNPGINAEEWLITPQVTVEANSQLRFFTKQTLTGDTGTLYQVRVSSSSDPSDLSAYTVVESYTETALSQLTPSQLDFEEKIVTLPFTGARYMAFVKVFTAASTIPSGDRWLIDDVKIIEVCNPPTNFGVTDVSTSGTTLTWASTAANFDIEYGPSGFTPGTGTVISNVPNNTVDGLNSYAILPPTLSPSTAYQFYVTAHCSSGNDSLITGPFNWVTAPLGSSCSGPIVIANPLPYSNDNNTLLFGNFVNPGSPGSLCGTSGDNYLASNDVVYSYTVPATTTGLISIQMNPKGTANTGVFVYASCADFGVNCLAGVGNSNSSVRNIPALSVTAGQTIFIVISATFAITDFEYTLILQDVNCTPPSGLTATGTGPTSANLSWLNPGGATEWEVFVQAAGAPIPTTPGVAANTNINFSVNSLTASGAPLQLGTPYQYWVRSKCPNGTFSPWSGPRLFNTTVCSSGCNYTFTLTALFGGGWNGSTMLVTQNGLTIATLGSDFTSGNEEVVSVPLCDGPYQLFWNNGGDFSYDVGVIITNSFGQIVYVKESGEEQPNTVLYNGLVNCAVPDCLSPTGLTATAPGTSTAILEWVPNGPNPLSWNIYAVPVGQAPPTPQTIPNANTTLNPYTITGLIPDTEYVYYVSAVCSLTSSSLLSAPSESFFTLPTCPRPTSPIISGSTLTSVVFNWTPGGSETAWEYIVLPVNSTEPAADNAGWLPAPGHPFTIDNLTSGTGYDFYVRAICSSTDKSKPAKITGYTTVCSPETQCNYTFTLQPSQFGGGGWSGNIMTVLQNGVPVAFLGPQFTEGMTPVEVQVGLCPGIVFELFWNQVDNVFDNGIGVSITNPQGQLIYGLDAFDQQPGSTLFQATAQCVVPTCVPPTNIIVTNVGLTTLSVIWTDNNIPAATSWDILVLPATAFPPTPITEGFTTVTGGVASYTYPNLTPGTSYTVYIRSNCSDTDKSFWSVGKDFSTLLCPPANTCDYSFVMTDSFGDSWNGNTMNVIQNGSIVGVLTGPSNADGQSPVTQVISLCNDLPFELFWNEGGNFPGEVVVSILNQAGTVLFTHESGNDQQGSSLFSGTVNCVPATCPKPVQLYAYQITETSATLAWTEAGSATQYEYYIVPVGSPAPTPATQGDPATNPITVSLESATTYTFYVRAICSESDVSNWSIPATFSTLITNDECIDAINVPVNPDQSCAQIVAGSITGATASNVTGSCTGTADDDVWFSFTATSTAQSISFLNLEGSATTLNHILYKGETCGNLTQIYCSTELTSYAAALVPGAKYYVRVYSRTGAPGQTATFDVCVGTFAAPISASTTVYNPEQLVRDVLINSTCAEITNIAFSTGTNFGSTANGIGYFAKENSAFPFQDGIVLTSGNANSAVGPNMSTLSEGGFGWDGDEDLQQVLVDQGISGTLSNATSLEFDFVPLIDTVSFNFLFASEEYGVYQCSYSDAFAFLLTNSVTNVTTNLAVIPNTNIPVSVTTIHNGQYNSGCSDENAEYFGTYYGAPEADPLSAPINFNGITVPLTAFSQVTPGVQYHIKMVIADFGPFGSDSALDSAVFLQGGSFGIGDINLGNNFLEANGTAVCPGETQIITTALDPTAYTFSWEKNGVPIEGETSSSLAVTEEGSYTIVVEYQGSICSSFQTVIVEFYDTVVPGTADNLVVCGNSANAEFNLTLNRDAILAPLLPNHTLGYYTSLADAQQGTTGAIATPDAYTNISNPQTIYVRVQNNVTGCYGITTFDLVVQDLPEFTLPSAFSICAGSSSTIAVTPTNFELSEATYSWTLDGATLPDITSSIVASATGIYEVTVNHSGCIASQSVTVTVSSEITPVFDAIAALCQGNTPPVLPTISNNNVSGTWSPSVIATADAGTMEYCFTPDATQTCALPVCIQVTVNPGPVVTVSDVNSCDKYVLPALAVGNYFSAPDGVGSIAAGTEYNQGTYTIYVYAEGGICTDQKSFVLNIADTPELDVVSDIVSCDGSDYTLPSLTTGNYYTQAGGLGEQIAAGTVLTTSQTVYVYAANTSGTAVCTSETSFTVSVGTPSEFNIQGECEGSEYVLSVMSGSSIADGAEYQWLDPNGNAIAGADKPSVTVAIAGTYSLVVTTAGCSVTQTFMANSISCMIQRGISPRGTNGGDGKNDYFDLTSLNVTKLEIFNRYGTQVYSKVNYSREWYGQSDKGEELADGTYFYVIERAGVEPVTGWIYINREK